MDDSIAYLGLVDDEDIDIDAAALDLAALDHPDVAIESYVEVLDAIVDRLGDIGEGAATATAQAALLAQVLGEEFGFVGDAETYDDPANADLIRVIDRRRGLPVALSILYVGAARRVGWEADALDVPGHVVVRIGSEVAPALIDPFHGGAAIGAEQIALLLDHAGRRGPAVRRVDAMDNRATLMRLLLNQATRAEQGGDADRALKVYARMTTIAPGEPNAWWQRARLELADGQVAPARASLSAMLEITRDPALRGRITDTLESLAGV